jgi:hypothetical protein
MGMPARGLKPLNAKLEFQRSPVGGSPPASRDRTSATYSRISATGFPMSCPCQPPIVAR